MANQPDTVSSNDLDEFSDSASEDEAWKDRIPLCKHSQVSANASANAADHHSFYHEVSSENIRETIKERIGNELDFRTCFEFYLDEEISNLKGQIDIVKTYPKDEWPGQMRITCAAIYHTDKYLYLKDSEKRLEVAKGKKDQRLQKIPKYMRESLDIVTEEIMLKIDGVVRIQRPAIEGKREHGSGTGILVRLNWSQTHYTVRKKEKEDFAILTNNHLIKDDSEVNGSTIDFFYDAAAGDAEPQRVVTKNVTKVIAWSPTVPSGQEATDECMDFSILKFDTGTDEEFIKTLRRVALYLNEFLQNDMPTRPHLDFPIPLLIIAISHPHGSNKRISFGSVKEEEVLKLLCGKDDSVPSSIQYNLTTCQGCSGCPVLAIQMDAKGYIRAALQFLHFKSKKGIVVRKLYETCKANPDFAWKYGLFGNALVSREMTSQTPTGVGFVTTERRFLWHDEDMDGLQ